MSGKIFEFNVYVLPMDSDEKIPAKLIRKSSDDNLTVKFNNIKESVVFDGNWFRTVRNLDKLLNTKGYRLLCNGTSLGVNCYGIHANMTLGTRAYSYNCKIVEVVKYSPWNRYATKEEQDEFLRFLNEKYMPLTKNLLKAKEEGKSNEELHKMREEWLRKKGITLDNFWKKELWE